MTPLESQGSRLPQSLEALANTVSKDPTAEAILLIHVCGSCNDTPRVLHHEIRTNDQTTRRNNARETGEWSPHALERYHGRMRHKRALVHDVALVYGGLNRHLFLILPNPITGLVRKLMVLKISTAWTSNP